MAKQTFLTLVNRVLTRIDQSEITDTSNVSGHAKLIVDFFNEGQLMLFNEISWYSLYTTRQFDTVSYNAATISFANSDPDTIDDSASGLSGFEAGMEVLVEGSTSNNKVVTVDTATSSSLTLQSTDTLTTESAGDSVTLTAITYPSQSNYGRGIDLMDITNNRILTEDISRNFDTVDPNLDLTGIPTHFSYQDDGYRLHPIPGGTYTLRERYWKQPTQLSASTDTTDLPIEVENVLIYWVYIQMLTYLNKFNLADRTRIDFVQLYKKARVANKKKIDRLNVMQKPLGRGAGRLPVYDLGRYSGLR